MHTSYVHRSIIFAYVYTHLVITHIMNENLSNSTGVRKVSRVGFCSSQSSSVCKKQQLPSSRLPASLLPASRPPAEHPQASTFAVILAAGRPAYRLLCLLWTCAAASPVGLPAPRLAALSSADSPLLPRQPIQTVPFGACKASQGAVPSVSP